MKFSPLILRLLIAGALALCSSRAAQPLPSSAIHLSGRLSQAGAPTAGEHEFRFELFTTETGNTIAPLTQSIVATETVVSGAWQTAIDFRRFGGINSLFDETVISHGLAMDVLEDTSMPSIYTRSLVESAVRAATLHSWRAIEGNWLQISVRRVGSPAFVALSPRQKLGSVPRALTAFTAEHATVAGTVAEGGVNAQSLAPGAITAPTIAPGTLVRSVNGLQDAVTLAAGTGVFLNAVDNTIVINATGGGGTPSPGGNFMGANNENSFGSEVTVSVIGGGSGNSATKEPGAEAATGITIAGGERNSAVGISSTVGGGTLNRALGHSATIAGGNANSAEGFAGSVGGGYGNYAAPGATVAGGNSNRAEGPNSFVGGGIGNKALYNQSVIGGGNNNIAHFSLNGTIGGGFGNTITNAEHGFVGGGQNNHILDAAFSSVLGGLNNHAESSYSVILGGEGNRTEGPGGVATVLGGSYNLASGTHSIAAGYRAHATHAGSFVWNAWGGNPFASLREFEFAVHAPGGVRLNTDGAGLFVDGQRIATGPVAPPNAAVTVLTSGGFDAPQARLTQENANDFVRLRLETGPKVWDIAGGPDGSLRFYGNGADRLIIGPDGPQISTTSGALTVNGRAVAFVDQLGQGGGQPGGATPISATVAQGTAITGISTDTQGGVGVVAEGRVGLRATSNNLQGAAVQAIQLNGSGYAGDFAGKVKISSTLEANGGLRVGGALRVNGLGENTPTAAFRLVPELMGTFIVTNPSGPGSLLAILDHPSLNGNPNALLMLTPVNREAIALYQRSTDVMRFDFLQFYPDAPESPAALRGRWAMDITRPPQGGGGPVTGTYAVFNAMIVTP